MSLKAGEKIMVFYPSKPFVPCSRTHLDRVAVRVSDLDVNLERPEHREKSVVLRTSDIS